MPSARSAISATWSAALSDKPAATIYASPIVLIFSAPCCATNTSKRERILNQLQPAYRAGHLRFSEGLPEHVKERLKVEFSKFPKSARDDLLDTLADQYQERDDFGAVRERNSTEQIMKRYQEQAMGIQPYDWSVGNQRTLSEEEMWV